MRLLWLWSMVVGVVLGSVAAGCSARAEPAGGGPPAEPGVDAGPVVGVDAGPVGVDVPIPPGSDGGLREECGNRDDEDLDGRVDEGCSVCAPGEDMRPCYDFDPTLAGVGMCVRGTQRCLAGLEFGNWSECPWPP